MSTVVRALLFTMRTVFLCALTLVIAESTVAQTTNNYTSDPNGFMILLKASQALFGSCWECSGSLVAKNWILTAAQCVHNADFVLAFVSAAFKDSCSHSTSISRNDIFIHPLFRIKEVFSGWSTELFHDVALMRYTPEIACDRISPVRLPDKNVRKEFYHNKSVLLVRFNSSCSSTMGLSQPTLSLVTVDNIGQGGYCPFYVKGTATEHNGEPMEYDKLCVFPQELTRMCYGDISAHLLLPLTGELIGFMSNPRERDCGVFQRVLFTQVSYYVPWIENVIGCVEERKGKRCGGLPLTDGEDNENQATNNTRSTSDPFAGFGFLVKLAVFEDVQCSVCSAAFIAKNWIVTAAHCIRKASHVVAFIGPPFEGNCRYGYNIRKSEFFIHPSFAVIENELFNDIALIRFRHRTACDRISPIRLPGEGVTKEFYKNKRVLWVRFGSSCDRSPPTLFESARILPSDDYCLSVNQSLKEDQLCVSTGKYEHTNTCLGDARGLLIMPTGELIGFLSKQSATYCKKLGDSLFTQVSYHKSWIESVINCVEKGMDSCDCLSLSEQKKEVLHATNNDITGSYADSGFIVRLQVARGRQCSICSGSFIAKNWILTAAHCIHGADSVVAYVGPPPFEEGTCNMAYNISKSYFYIHPAFAEIENTTTAIYKFANDIALIKITNYMHSHPIARLPARSVQNKSHEYKGLVFSRFATACQERHAKLSVYFLNVDRHNHCRINGTYSVPGQLCILVGQENLCYGDTGGLLFMPTFSQLIGLMSLPARHCENDFGVLFTEVSYYIPWIEKVTGVNPKAIMP